MISDKEYKTCNQMAKECGLAVRTMRLHAQKMLDLGEWEFIFVKTTNHYTRAYRRKKK